MKKSILMSLGFLILSTTVNASTFSLVSVKNKDGMTVLPLTLNNQSDLDISTDSPLVPDAAKMIPSKGAANFDIKIQSRAGTEHMRFYNNFGGCDFYIDTTEIAGPIAPGFITSITGVGIDSSSRCDVFAASGINHLAVAISHMM